MPSFPTAIFVLGLILVGGALLSGLARRTFLSLTALFVLTGFALGAGGLRVIAFDARSSFVQDVAYIALIVILFRDGLEVQSELLRRAWRVPLRKLALAMPLTALAVAAVAVAVVGLPWSEALLLGALLSPTDPVLSSGIVTDPRVPERVRHSLNLESGLNDGLALPAVLAFLAALRVGSGHFLWWRFVLQDVGLGFVFGLAMGLLASVLLPREEPGAANVRIPDHQRTLYALGVAFATYGVAHVTISGNALIAVFVAAIALGIRRPDLRVSFAEGAAELVEMVKLGVFVVFGSLLTVHGLLTDGWAAVAVVILTLVVIRPLAVNVALLGTRTDRFTRAFMGWFGPKGVATMTFSLLVLNSGIASASRIFDLAALAVFCSILVHGLSDTTGVRLIARRQARASQA